MQKDTIARRQCAPLRHTGRLRAADGALEAEDPRLAALEVPAWLRVLLVAFPAFVFCNLRQFSEFIFCFRWCHSDDRASSYLLVDQPPLKVTKR